MYEMGRRSQDKREWLLLFGREERGDGMNHDYAHCADYSSDCPKDCFRARLTGEALDKHWTMVDWAHFKGNEPVTECREYVSQNMREVTT